MASLLSQRPHLPRLFPHMLERGDMKAREFALNFTRAVETPELLQVLYDFALSRYGNDSIRMEALQFIRQQRPEMLPENKQVPMWINGQQTELFMLGFEITDEPEGIEGVSEEILKNNEAAVDLLLNDEHEAAELLLREIIAEAPDFCSAHNQLAVACELQGRHEEARSLVEETHARFPDYFFSRVALARMMTREGRIEEARELVEPLLALQKLHISEFRALARVQMDIALAVSQPETARGWLEMWRQIEEDNPEIAQWEMTIDGPGKLLKGFQKLLGRSQGKKSSRR